MKNKQSSFYHTIATGIIARCHMLFLILFIIPPAILPASAQESPAVSSDVLSHYTRNYPQQKVFLHTDRDTYFDGETIWFQAYVVDAFRLLPDSLSDILYVELTDREGEHLAHLRTRIKQGVSYGDILLPDSMPEGNYQLRAYTNWMRNFPREYFFSKQIYVHNPAEKNYISRRDIRRNKRFNLELEEQAASLQAGVYPEGGNLVAGIENRLAFRVSNLLGEGVEASVLLVDEDMEEQLQAETTYYGMGDVSFVPQAGKKYYLHVRTGTEEKVLDLPLPQQQSYLLQADMDGEWLEVRVMANFQPSELGISDKCHVMLQAKGQVWHFQTVPLGKGMYRYQIPLEILPDGIGQLTLFDGNDMPVAERLVFMNPGRIAETTIENEAVLSEVPSGERNADDLRMASVAGMSVHLSFDPRIHGGTYSMAVLGVAEGETPKRESIAAYMLLRSELGPLYGMWDESLFDGGEHQAALLDLIMMTHGWRRFDWSNLLAGNFPEVNYPVSDGLEISGKITALSSSVVPKGVTVELSIQNEKTDRYFTKTDEKGYFSFSELQYSGMHEAKLSTPEADNGRNLWLEIDSYDLIKVPFQKNMFTRHQQIIERGSGWKRIKRPSLHLTQISVRSPSQQSRGFSKPDQIIYGRDMENRYDRMYDLLLGQVHGLMQDGRGLMYFRGKTSFRQNIEPLFIVNGVPGHKNSFLMVRPREMERLEVYRGTSAAIYGSRGANGALSVYTRVGDETTRYLYEFVFRGYHAPRIFEPSNICPNRYKEMNVPVTLHWEPNIQPDNQGRATISFPKTGEEEAVWVVVQGIDAEGRITASMQRLYNPAD